MRWPVGGATAATLLPMVLLMAAPALGASQKDFRECEAHNIDACERVIRDRSESASRRAVGYLIRGVNFFIIKSDNDRALADFNEAIRLDPRNAKFYHNRASVWWSLKNYGRIVADYGEAIRLDPSDDFAYTNRCWARAQFNRDLQNGLTDCNEALRIQPNKSGDLLMRRGWIHLRMGQPDAALADFNAAMPSAYSLYGRAHARHQKGDATGASADLKAALTSDAEIADRMVAFGIARLNIAPAPAPPSAPAPPVQSARPPPPVAPPQQASPPKMDSRPEGMSASAATDTADCSLAETHWKSVETLGALIGYEDHLKRFPDCVFAVLAKAKIEMLRK